MFAKELELKDDEVRRVWGGQDSEMCGLLKGDSEAGENESYSW